MMLESLLPALFLASMLNPQTVEQEGVRVETAIQAQVFTWTVTNVDAPPIMSVEIPLYRTYNEFAPDGWNLAVETDSMRAWTEQLSGAIDPGQSKTFSARGGSRSGVLGERTLTIGFDGDVAPARIPGVWGPVPQPLSLMAAVAATVAGLALVHAVVAGRGGGVDAPGT